MLTQFCHWCKIPAAKRSHIFTTRSYGI